MRPRLLWAPQAREDLIEIYIAIGLDNIDAAERFYAAIDEKIGMLVHYPRMGVRRPEIAASARMLVPQFEPHLLIG
jgi:toxin ParE1/3/4